MQHTTGKSSMFSTGHPVHFRKTKCGHFKGAVDPLLLRGPLNCPSFLSAKESESRPQCAVTTLLREAKEGGPEEATESSVSCSPVNRNEAKVGQLDQGPVHQTSLICIPEFLFQVQKYVIISLENAHTDVESREGHGSAERLVAQHLSQDGARRAARQRAFQQAQPHVVEVGVEGYGQGGHAPRLAPVRRAAP